MLKDPYFTLMTYHARLWFVFKTCIVYGPHHGIVACRPTNRISSVVSQNSHEKENKEEEKQKALNSDLCSKQLCYLDSLGSETERQLQGSNRIMDYQNIINPLYICGFFLTKLASLCLEVLSDVLMKETLRYLAGVAGPSGYGSNSTAEQVTEASSSCSLFPSQLTAIVTGQ